MQFSGRLRPHQAPHLSDDQLLEVYALAADGGHLDTCPECRARYDEVTRLFARLRDDAVGEADAIFTAERLDAQRDRILRRLEHQGQPAEILMFPRHSSGRPAGRGLFGPARRWVAGAAVAGLAAGWFLGVEVDRRVDARSAARLAKAPAEVTAAWKPDPAQPQDEQILTEIEDALAGPTRRVLELRTLDAMTTPPEIQEASFVPR